eukprot:9234049-Lingulodinium_polyedra.AAC.1
MCTKPGLAIKVADGQPGFHAHLDVQINAQTLVVRTTNDRAHLDVQMRTAPGAHYMPEAQP